MKTSDKKFDNKVITFNTKQDEFNTTDFYLDGVHIGSLDSSGGGLIEVEGLTEDENLEGPQALMAEIMAEEGLLDD